MWGTPLSVAFLQPVLLCSQPGSAFYCSSRKVVFLADGLSVAGCAMWEDGGGEHTFHVQRNCRGLTEVRCPGRAELWVVSWEMRSRNPWELD